MSLVNHPFVCRSRTAQDHSDPQHHIHWGNSDGEVWAPVHWCPHFARFGHFPGVAQQSQCSACWSGCCRVWPELWKPKPVSWKFSNRHSWWQHLPEFHLADHEPSQVQRWRNVHLWSVILQNWHWQYCWNSWRLQESYSGRYWLVESSHCRGLLSLPDWFRVLIVVASCLSSYSGRYWLVPKTHCSGLLSSSDWFRALIIEASCLSLTGLEHSL